MPFYGALYFFNFLKIIIIPNELTRMLQERSEEIF